ncbi:MAG: UDP-N-acetylmuramate dehydrogenase [Aureispira sp.]|nr:UDP-N-acetylmuramate dehydrogenase [Aureispira sp.]
MIIEENYNIQAYNTFGIAVQAAEWAVVETTEDLIEATQTTLPLLILGGGSNILFTQNFAGRVLLNRIAGKSIVEEDKDSVLIKVGAGENWHELVLWTIAQGWCGIENLSLIPGTVGAAPIQNIGAYGVELKDVFERLEAVEIETGEFKIFEKEDCDFGYRDSVFKREWKSKLYITQVYLRLSKLPKFNTSYGAIQDIIVAQGGEKITAQAISDAVVAIRTKKLPNPTEIGNGGSFFKNPIVHKMAFELLEMQYPKMPHYIVDDQRIKIPAGWLIQEAGWKGYRNGDAGVHKNQALVLVNYGKASGAEIWTLATTIQDSVYKKFGIELELEINVF